jgi:tRNA (adenine57-N1/adenine58-N1)-methyltransferase
MTQAVIEEGDVVVLWTSENRARTVRVLPDRVFSTHQGDLPLKALIGREFGYRFDLTKGWGLALPASMEDRICMLRRSTNILYPKDIGLILMKLLIRPGSTVVELGTGAGAMTTALADAVSPGGTVYTFDIREDHLTGAQRNVRRADVEGDVRFAIREPGTPLPVEPVYSVVMDIPEPWTEMESVDRVLLKGGRLASMNPTYNQIEKMAVTMKRHGYILIECVETIFRRIVPVEGRVRPSRMGIPHTEFMLFGVKAGEELAEDIDQFYPER